MEGIRFLLSSGLLLLPDEFPGYEIAAGNIPLSHTEEKLPHLMYE
jgi:hypothetical protein